MPLGYAGVTTTMQDAYIKTVECLRLKLNGTKSYWGNSTFIFNEDQCLMRKYATILIN